ncbi:uncharacterized protein BCR38DRAFT_406109 [Pseudomassariella vexata]|uniref:Uncharacterized protein n=1 Tax=Pseudomassariella vexata TaxID=1141098 RepID=A0A1Y2EG10_9PEZI|nr:uncharacterized protein BCR38DRAFT_406109 [Pseudomassariella vexata]ORY70510.1 hypothetical protein BCR38DRAFT_406109 [Pseudomassariella vexata]
MATSSNMGALTTTFAPPSNCNQLYYAENVGGWYQYEDTTTCFPSSFNRNYTAYYSPGVCFSGYTIAGITTDASTTGVSVATCCPSGYTTIANRRAKDIDACRSKFASSTVTVVDVRSYSGDLLASSGNTATTILAGDWVNAYGPILRRESTDPEWDTAVVDTLTTSATSTTSTGTSVSPGSTAGTSGIPSVTAGSNTSSSSASASTLGLSPGAKAGIGVGVSIGALVVIGAVAAAYFLGRRSRRQKSLAPETTEPQDHNRPPPTENHPQDPQDNTAYAPAYEPAPYVPYTDAHTHTYMPTHAQNTWPQEVSAMSPAAHEVDSGPMKFELATERQ